MDISIGNQYSNKTWRFLLPSLQGYGNMFINKLSPVFKLAAGIYDDTFEDTAMYEGRNLFIMIDVAYKPKYVEDYLMWLREHPSYVGDYPVDALANPQRKHIIVVKVPEVFNKAYDNFIKGKYSEMYEREHLNILFKRTLSRQNEDNPLIQGKLLDYEILSKTGVKARAKHKIRILEEFGEHIDNYTLDIMEWELPLECSKEIFYSKRESVYV